MKVVCIIFNFNFGTVRYNLLSSTIYLSPSSHPPLLYPFLLPSLPVYTSALPHPTLIPLPSSLSPTSILPPPLSVHLYPPYCSLRSPFFLPLPLSLTSPSPLPFSLIPPLSLVPPPLPHPSPSVSSLPHSLTPPPLPHPPPLPLPHPSPSPLSLTLSLTPPLPNPHPPPSLTPPLTVGVSSVSAVLSDLVPSSDDAVNEEVIEDTPVHTDPALKGVSADLISKVYIS